MRLHRDVTWRLACLHDPMLNTGWLISNWQFRVKSWFELVTQLEEWVKTFDLSRRASTPVTLRRLADTFLLEPTPLVLTSCTPVKNSVLHRSSPTIIRTAISLGSSRVDNCMLLLRFSSLSLSCSYFLSLSLLLPLIPCLVFAMVYCQIGFK